MKNTLDIPSKNETDAMKTEIWMMTPAMAKQLLTKNSTNRPIRPIGVEGFRIAYMRGEWKLTHQGVAISKSGNLLDGQHRLLFISDLPEGTRVPINVTLNQDDDTFDAIDVGMKRTTADVYRVSKDLSSTAYFLARIYSSGMVAYMSNPFIKCFMDWIQDDLEKLKTACPNKAKLWSTSSMYAAAIVQMKRGHDENFIFKNFNALINSDFDNMSPTAKFLVQQQIKGTLSSGRGRPHIDLFIRGLRVFDSSKQNVSKLQINDPGKILTSIRQWMDIIIKDEKILSMFDVDYTPKRSPRTKKRSSRRTQLIMPSA